MTYALFVIRALFIHWLRLHLIGAIRVFFLWRMSALGQNAQKH